jgi:radical SAM superfamily enzyme YgiQ (UPF0313 family)
MASALRDGIFFDTKHVEIVYIDDQLQSLKDPQQLPGSFLAAIKPDIVAIQAITSTLNNVIHLSKMTKALFPNTLVVLGGIAPTQRQAELLENNPTVDIVVTSEGEITFSELVYEYGAHGRKNFGSIKGLSFRNDEGEVVHNLERSKIHNLDMLPFPARDIADMETYLRVSRGRAGNLITSRGCSYVCAYCYSKHQWGVGRRKQSVMRAIEEIKHMYEEYGINRIRIEDDDFIEDRAWIMDFCRNMIDMGLGSKIEWEAKGRPNLMETELLTLLRKAGCFRLMMGVETLNPVLLKKLQRGITVERTERAMQMMKDTGMAVQATVILGIPGEDVQSIRHTLNWLDDRLSGRDIVGACFFTPFDRVKEDMSKKLDYKVEIENIDCYTGHMPVTSSDACSYEELWNLYEDMGNNRIGDFNRLGHLASRNTVNKRITSDH